MYWKIVARTDARARALADRHYSRKKPRAAEFCPPGNNIVLLGLNDDALWVSHRPDPNAHIARPRFDGLDYADNPYFRNESGRRSSDLIYEALAITRYIWNDYYPRDGFHSFVDPRKVAITRWNGREMFAGFIYWLVGFMRWPYDTGRGLYRYVLPLDLWQQIPPQAPAYEQMRLLA